jgi:hypothetical protein
LLTERNRHNLISVTEVDCMSKPTDSAQGALDLLVLKILALEPLWARLSAAISHVAPLEEG